MKIVLISLIFVITSCSKKKDRILPTKNSLIESVYSSVTIQPDSLHQAYAIIASVLEANLVVEGDAVLKNEAIILIINNVHKLKNN